MPADNSSLLSELREVIVRLARSFQKGISPSATQMEVLHALNAGDGLSVPNLAKRVGTSRQNLQLVVDRLLRDNQLEAVVNPAHKRSPLYRLTDRGRQLLTEANRQQGRRLEDFGFVDPVELKQTIGLLHRLQDEWIGPIQPVPDTIVRKHRSKDLAMAAVEPVEDENDLPVSLL